MPEENLTEEQKAAEAAKAASEAASKKTEGADNNGNVIDVSKLSDADWDKIFASDKLYTNSRFKELNEKAKQGSALAKEKVDAEKAKLAEQGELQKLIDIEKAEKETLKTQLENVSINSEIRTIAAELGAIDAKAVEKLIDRQGIKIEADGSVTGAKEAVEALLKSSPYLKGDGSKRLGGGSNPQDANDQTPRFTLSQIKDPVFYRAHEKEIGEAYAKGLIRDDTGTPAA